MIVRATLRRAGVLWAGIRGTGLLLSFLTGNGSAARTMTASLWTVALVCVVAALEERLTYRERSFLSNAGWPASLFVLTTTAAAFIAEACVQLAVSLTSWAA